MRPVPSTLVLAVFAVLPACEQKRGAGGLTRRQCSELVRRMDRLRSESGAMGESLRAGQGAGVDACLEQATERVFRCVMQARSADDLAECEMLSE